MATQQEQDEFAKLTVAGSVIVPVKEFPRIPDSLKAVLIKVGGPQAKESIEQWEAELEEWRKSVSIGQ